MEGQAHVASPPPQAAGEHIIFPQCPLLIVDRNTRRAAAPSQSVFPVRSRPSQQKQQQRRHGPPTGPRAEPKSLGFVSYSGDPRQKSKARQSYVKSFVRKSYFRDLWRKQHAAGPKATNLLPAGSTVVAYGAVPFDLTARDQELLHYYLTTVPQWMYPFQPRLAYDPLKADWFPMVTTDEMFLHAVIYTSLVHRSACSGSEPLPQNYHSLLARVLKPLRSRLSDPQRLDDTTIATVFCLAVVEGTFLQNLDQYAVHMSGALALVNARGGVARLGAWLQVKIRKADLEGATNALTKPALPAVEPASGPVGVKAGRPPPDPSDDFDNIVTAANASTGLSQIVGELRRFSVYVDHVLSQRSAAIDPHVYESLTLDYQHKLLSGIGDDAGPAAELLRIGALVFLKSITRGIWMLSTDTLAQRLISLLDRVESPGLLAPLYTYICFSAALSFRDDTTQLFFVDKLLSLLKNDAGQVMPWDAVKAGLRKYLWVEEIQQNSFLQLWTHCAAVSQLHNPTPHARRFKLPSRVVKMDKRAVDACAAVAEYKPLVV